MVMDSGSNIGFFARILFGLAGVGLGLWVTTLGFANDGHLVNPTPLLPGVAWLLGVGGLAFAVASALWVFAVKRD